MISRAPVRLKLVLLVGLMIASLALALAPVLGGAPEHTHAAEPINISTLLLTDNRDRLSICVQPVDNVAVTSAEARAGIEATLPELARHRYWRAAGLAIARPTVALGCPGDPYLLQPGVAMAGAKTVGESSAGRVETASQYRIFVFVLPEERIKLIFGASANRAAIQEILCRGSGCAEATTGLYLSPQELRNPQFLKTVLEQAVGLEPRTPVDEQPGPPRKP